jgi:hypothetical protein
MKSLILIASLGLALGACTVRSDTVVQRPAPVPVVAGTTSSTTYVQPDAASPSGTRTTTVYRN